jgi:hypothetical protein
MEFPMMRFNQTVIVVGAVGIAVSTLGAQDKHWGYEDGPESVGPAKSTDHCAEAVGLHPRDRQR